MKIRIISLIICSFLILNLKGQELFKVESAEVSFLSEAPLEKIEAICKKAQGLIKTRDG